MSTWTHEYFDLFGDMTSCLMNTFLPCHVFGQAKEKMGGGYVSNCLMFVCCGCFRCCFVSTLRDEVKSKYNIENGGTCDGCLGNWFCNCCALMQVDRELKAQA
eukprot:Awhi_evm1s15152